MSKKKIDDIVLLEMVRAGKKQKDIAEHFGVTPAAVCKRLKLLVPVPKSFAALTEKEQKFVQGRVQGKSQTLAAMDAYDVSSRESAKALGHTISKAPHVRQAIEDLMDYHGLSRSFRVKKVREHVDNPDPNVSLRALDMSWKLDGSYAPKKSVNLLADIDIPVDLSKYRNDREDEDEEEDD